jgi:hypothetical protein
MSPGHSKEDLMRRLVLLLGLMALVVALPASHGAFAKSTKVDVCHVNAGNQAGFYGTVDDVKVKTDGVWQYNYTYIKGYTWRLGKVISVSEDAVDAHVAHGDSTWFYALTDERADYIESFDIYDQVLYVVEYGDPDGDDYYYHRSAREGIPGRVTNADCYWVTYDTEVIYHEE